MTIGDENTILFIIGYLIIPRRACAEGYSSWSACVSGHYTLRAEGLLFSAFH